MFVYVILHFRTLDITKMCVEHLLSTIPDSKIVIVDNGSGDGSGQELQRTYAHCGNISIILSPDNVGFAKGNNIGYKYAVDTYNPDYVVVMNNDVLIDQNIEPLIDSYMTQNGIDVCGPDILTPDGDHQNPLLRKPFSTPRLIKQIIIDYVRLTCLRLKIFHNRILGTYKNVVKKYHNANSTASNVSNCILHGSCLIYGRNYLSKSPYAFVPVTFLYGEEMILFDYIQRLGLSSGVCGSAQVMHLGGKSTDTGGNLRERQIRKMECVIDSMYQQIKLRIGKATC
ncbi:MAG: glycosyltransferase [Bacteroidales bacterium]|nr:glycosyltransferase [Bacteroidales bacterium]